MSSTPQKRALSNYRLRLRGMARFEVLGRDADRELIRSLARRLAGNQRKDFAELRILNPLRASTCTKIRWGSTVGLDSVELIFAVEDAFQIHLDDAEVGGVATVGELHALVQSKLRQTDAKRCLTSVAFYRTRRAMVEALPVERRAIKPATRLDALFPEAERAERWDRVRRRLGLKMPELSHPAWLEMLSYAAGIGILAATVLGAGLSAGWVLLLILPGLLVGKALLRLTPRLASELPDNEATVGDLVRDVLASNHGRLMKETGGWNEQESWETLCRLIVRQVGVEREKIRPEARMVDDLGID